MALRESLVIRIRLPRFPI